VRATAVEVVARLDLLSGGGGLPPHEQQVCALEALQMYAPMGHALGLSAVAAQLEDRCFQVGRRHGQAALTRLCVSNGLLRAAAAGRAACRVAHL
jgi:(p)ppGpp synthase/HD superfamily hydrolase